MASVKLPKKSAAQYADMLYETREKRLKLQKEVDKLQATETALKEWFIANMSKKDTTGIAGRKAKVLVDSKPVPQVEDWKAFYAHIKKNNAFEFLQRRVNESAVKERWEQNKTVPGVTKFNAPVVSCTKR